MRQTITTGIVSILLGSAVAHAEVPDLAGAIQALDATAFAEFETSITEVDTVITADVDFALDTAVVNEALEQGLITEAEAGDLESALDTIEANAEFFDFDIAAFLAEGMANGTISAAEANEVLTAFSQLSPAGKAIVGASGFSPFDVGGVGSGAYVGDTESVADVIDDCVGGVSCDGDDLLNGAGAHSAADLQSDAFESLSAADKAIVAGVSLTGLSP